MKWRNWRIFYGDGSRYSDADGSPYDAPRLNVQAIVGFHPQNGRYTVSNKDAYWWEPSQGRWRGGDRHGEWIYMLRLGPRVVLYGEQIGDDEYNACISAALTDQDFPEKTARGRGEEFLHD